MPSSPRVLSASSVHAAIVDAIGEMYCHLEPRTKELLARAYEQETDELARDMLAAILQNAELAPGDQIPLCQDTGLLIIFAELGGACLIEGGTLPQIAAAAAAAAWSKYYLRASLAPDPLFDRGPVGCGAAGSPAPILHLLQVPGDRLTLRLALKGGGAENCSAWRMFQPAAKLAEIEDFIVQTVVSAGGKPCPPVLVGVGIGGDFELSALLAKRALLWDPDDVSLDRRYLELERRLLERINREGRGVQGMGGRNTALLVKVLREPCHIASLPVAVNLDCHAHRSTMRVL